MTQPDLVASIIAAIDAREALARAATPGPWRHNPNKHWRKPGTAWFEEAVFAGPDGAGATCVAGTGETDDPQSMADAAFIADNGPDVVIRGCVSDRKLLDEIFWYEATLDGYFGCQHEEAQIRAGQCPQRPLNQNPAVLALAESYGVELPERKHRGEAQ